MSSRANKKSGDSCAIEPDGGTLALHRKYTSGLGRSMQAVGNGLQRRALVGAPAGWYRPRRFRAPSAMQVRLEPQGKQLTISGRRRVGELVRSLGILAGTVMVIRGDELLTDDEFVDDADSIELRAVISGGAR